MMEMIDVMLIAAIILFVRFLIYNLYTVLIAIGMYAYFRWARETPRILPPNRFWTRFFL